MRVEAPEGLGFLIFDHGSSRMFASIWQPAVPLRATQIEYSIELMNGRRPARLGNWLHHFVDLALSCQAGTSPAAKARLFQGPDWVTGTGEQHPHSSQTWFCKGQFSTFLE